MRRSARSWRRLARPDLLLRSRVGRRSEALDVFPPLLELRRGLAEDVPGDADNLVSLTLLQAEYAGAARGGRARRRGGAAAASSSRSTGGPSARDPRNPSRSTTWPGCWRAARAAPHDPAREVELAEQAVALAPASGAYWNTLGVARYSRRRVVRRRRRAEESMRLRSGGDPYDWLFLAMARHRPGDAAEARRWLDRSLGWIKARAPHNLVLTPLREEALRLLGSGGLAAR